ncbi:hypothetical protein [Pseudomonas sp. Irchel 3E13]|uniref:hypothetical protein n=1 Tax=Pseudomonas sp. Irchel 3E13 TaxID=2008975 RepID=UPI00117ADCC5|nr:hypothetical protein [Pseudomonas sp. Irchel 3E13]
MFEVPFEEMAATVFVEEGAAGMAYMFGAADVQPGENKLRCAEGLALIRILDPLQAGVPKHLHKKWRPFCETVCLELSHRKATMTQLIGATRNRGSHTKLQNRRGQCSLMAF